MRRADNLTTFMYRLSLNLEPSTSWHPYGLSRSVMGLLNLYLYFKWLLVHVIFVVDIVVLGQSFRLFPVIIIAPVIHSHVSFT